MAVAVDLLDLATNGLVVPVANGSGVSITPVGSNTTGYTSVLIEWFLVLVGIILVAVAYDGDRKFGAIILLIVVLLMLLAAKKRGAY